MKTNFKKGNRIALIVTVCAYLIGGSSLAFFGDFTSFDRSPRISIIQTSN